RNYLLAESDVGDLAVVLGDADIARVQVPAKAVQQRLTDLRPEVAAQLRANRGEGAVGCDTIVVISNRQICAGGKALVVREVTHPGVIDELGDAGEWVRLRLHGILDVERSAQERVEGRSCRSTAKHRR